MTDDGMQYLYIAYSAIWLGWFFYLIYLHFKQSRLENDMKNIEVMVSDHGRKGKGKK